MQNKTTGWRCRTTDIYPPVAGCEARAEMQRVVYFTEGKEENEGVGAGGFLKAH
jgi:hypothetical protein